MNKQFEKWARTTGKFDMDREGAPAGMTYTDPRTQIAFDIWTLVAQAGVQIADRTATKGRTGLRRGAAHVAGVMRDTFGV